MIDKTNLVTLTSSQVARSLLKFKGQKFSLDGYKPLETIYDADPPIMSVKCCRQIGKSVSIGAILVSKGTARPFFNSLFVSPLSIQTSRFSKLYLKPFSESPLIKKHFKKYGDVANIFLKEFSNGSMIFLSYMQTESDSDRIRGIAADMSAADEVQDIAIDALPILYETLSASPHAFKRHYGTAKTVNNTLEILFNQGNGCEWCIKCTHCNKWNIPNTVENCMAMCRSHVGPTCMYCSQPIDVETGKWIAARPLIKDHLSFHIPRHVIGARTSPKMWADLQMTINSPESYSPSKIANEVFGVSSGQGGRILSENEAMACCDPSIKAFDTGWPMDYRGINNVVMGVDWSVTNSTKSFTVVTILGYDWSGKANLLYSERMNSVDIIIQVQRVIMLFHQFGCQRLHSDRGVGVVQGQMLGKSLGYDRVTMVQYTSQKVPARYDQVGGYLACDRTMVIDMVILLMKQGASKFQTPCWDLMYNFWADALAVFEEETLIGKRVYRKDEFHADDWLHSIVFAHTAYQVLIGEFNFADTGVDINIPVYQSMPQIQNLEYNYGYS